MIKTLLAGTLLSTGLFAGGILDTKEMNTDKKEKIEWQKSRQGESHDTSKSIETQKNEDASISMKQINPSEGDGEWSTVKPSTDEKKELPTQEGDERPEGAVLATQIQ